MQSLKNFLNNQSIPIVISIMALFIAFGTQDTPCLSANVCSAGSDPEFQNDVSFKSGTINKATLSHDLTQDNQYFLGDSGSSGTSTIALITKDSSNQEKLLTVNGGVVVGQSSVSEPGTLRVQTSTSPVLQIYGSSGWEDVSQETPSPNLYNSFAGDTGSITASSSTETINFKSNAPSLTFDVQGDSVFLNSVGGGGSFEPNIASYNLDNNLGYASNPNNYAPNSSTIYFGYDGTNDVTTEMYDIGNCWSTSIANIPSDNVNGLLFVYDTNCGSHPYKISYKIQMYDSTQGQSSQQVSRVSTQLYYVENSTTRHSIKYGDNKIDGYNQYSSSYVSGFNNTIYDEAIVCFGYDTSESNSIYLRVRGQSRSHIKGDTANYKFSTISMERLNLGSLNTCDNTVSPYPSMN